MLETVKKDSQLQDSQPHVSGAVKDALGHVKVLEFGAYAAGPCISKYLANFGASVIHVESTQRPDGFRLQYPPYKEGVVGLNRSGCFAFFNDSKKGVTLNLKHPKGLELAFRLVNWADIVNGGKTARGRLGPDCGDGCPGTCSGLLGFEPRES
jgi:crotonobetainyl-CoA:carnitine CoA-transferase CaiB-like acyl-CoA transferase